jgi:hypothetical protein
MSVLYCVPFPTAADITVKVEASELTFDLKITGKAVGGNGKVALDVTVDGPRGVVFWRCRLTLDIEQGEPKQVGDNRDLFRKVDKISLNGDIQHVNAPHDHGDGFGIAIPFTHSLMSAPFNGPFIPIVSPNPPPEQDLLGNEIDPCPKHGVHKDCMLANEMRLDRVSKGIIATNLPVVITETFDIKEFSYHLRVEHRGEDGSAFGEPHFMVSFPGSSGVSVAARSQSCTSHVW